MLTALLFITVCCLGYLLALFRGPFWGLLVYANIYFNSPNPSINWWGSFLPFHNWSYLTTVVILISMFLHRDRLSPRPIKTVYPVILFLALMAILTFTTSQFQKVSLSFVSDMLSSTIICLVIVKAVKDKWQLRTLWLTIILFTANLSVNAYLYGKRIHGRLENIGSSDSVGSNLFGLLLAGVIPFIIPFVCSGKKHERILCLLSLPFILNALVLCNSRGSIVALAGGFAVAFLFLADLQMKRKMGVLGVVLIALFIYLSDQELVNRISSLIQTRDAIKDDQQANTLSSGRIEIWRHGLQMVWDHPFGAGPGGFKQLAKEYLPAEILTVHADGTTVYADGETGIRGAHNSYLLVLVEQGPIGLLLWLCLCIGTWLNLYRASVKLKGNVDSDPFWRYAVFAMGISFVTSLLGGLFTARVYYEFFWWQIAMAVVLYYFVRFGDGENEDSIPELVSGIK